MYSVVRECICGLCKITNSKKVCKKGIDYFIILMNPYNFTYNIIIMKNLILLTFVFATYFYNWGQIYFENNFDRTIYVALGYYSETDEFSGWITRGWFKVIPGETAQLLSYNPSGQNLYYYAQTENGKKKFEGDASLLVNPSDKFYIKNADLKDTQTKYPSYKYYNFIHVDKGNWDFLKLKYTIRFYG